MTMNLNLRYAMRQLAFALLVALIGRPDCAAAQPPSNPQSTSRPRMYVLLWFDTEDLLLEASDDAALRLATFCTREGVKANFKLVGEKVRLLVQRGRRDVIEALGKHEIGYHTEFHSVHPTPAQYTSTLGWDEGVAEFIRREGRGVKDLKRVFGSGPTWYGQPGSSWCPQSFGALRAWDIPVYLDIGNHIGVEGRPHYYCGILTIYDLRYSLRVGLGRPEQVDDAKRRFGEARRNLLAEGGGVAHIFYHPCEFVHAQFWDGVNFRGGANPPREKWKVPPAKTPEQSRIAYENFESYIRWIKSTFDDVEFLTATDAARLYRDRARGRTFSGTEIREIASAVTPVQGREGITFQRRGDYALAPSEVLALLTGALAKAPDAGENPALEVVLEDTPLGPTGIVPEMSEPVETSRSQFVRTTKDVWDSLRRQGRVPGTVWLGSKGVPPEAYLGALAGVIAGGRRAETVEIRPAALTASKYVRQDSPRLWGWLFPEGFHAPHLMELAKLQAWTIKPAILRGNRSE